MIMEIQKTVYGFIYITTNLINGKKYLGQKKIDEHGKWRKYLGSGIAFKQAVKKYGVENFKREIIDVASNADELNQLEEKYTIDMDCVNDRSFYNLVYGGGTVTGLKFSEVTIQRLRELASGKSNYFYGKRYVGELNPFYGKNHTFESRRKMSLSHRGQNPWNKGKTGIYSNETIQKMIDAKKGKPLSESHKKAIQEAQKGENHPMFGKHQSEEAKEKIRQKQLGKKATDATKKKMSEAQLKRFAEKPNTIKYHTRKVLCVTTGKVFESVKDAAKYYYISAPSDISQVCKKKRKSAGKDKLGNRLVWEYLNESIPR